MNRPDPDTSPTLQDKPFLALLVATSLAFAWILWPFYGAVFWGVVLAILFAPLNRWLVQRLNGRRTLAALATLSVIVVMVILPLALITTALVEEGANLYERIQSGQWSFARYVDQVYVVLPDWLTRLLDRFDLADIGALRERLNTGLAEASRFLATRAYGIGQNTLEFVVSFFITLYLTFFLLRDGSKLARRIRDAVPLHVSHKRALFAKFATVVRATVKGNVVVAVVQGALGGVAFAFLGIHGALLWAVLMAFLSLLPAVGAAMVWAPVAIYLLATGGILHGLGLVAWGVLVMGLVDNVLRPILVGKDTRMPDYVVLISTLGGMAIFGLNGFVIGPAIAAMFIAVWDIFADANAGEHPQRDG